MAYARIEAAATKCRGECLTPDEIVRLAQMSRFDPRIAEMLVRYLARNFEELNPWIIRGVNLTSEWPQSLCVLVDIAEILVSSSKQDWKLWKTCIQFEIPKAAFQAFYVGLIAIDPRKNQEQIGRNLKPYSAWGFYNHELPITEKLGRIQKTLLSKSLRLELLKELIRKRSRFTVQDYIEALDHRVHRRQAERDLVGFKDRLVSSGNTKSRTYTKAARNLK